MEKSIVYQFEKDPKKLTSKDEHKGRPDNLNVETDCCYDHDDRILPHKESVCYQLTLEAPSFTIFRLFLFLFGGQWQYQVVHVEVTDSIQKALPDGDTTGIRLKPHPRTGIRLTLHPRVFVAGIEVEGGHDQDVKKDKDERGPKVAIAPGVCKEDKGY